VADCARIIVEQTQRMTTIIRRLLDFARRGEATRKRADLTAPVKRATSILDAIARKANVTLTIDAPEPIALDIDEGQIEQVVTNLVVNAIHATPANGHVDVKVVEEERAAPTGGELRDWAVVRVSDTGRGMDETTRARCMEPFFTTKEVGEGTGLGLAVVWGIVTDHNGWIDIASAPDQGSTFSVYLPR
jgi:signal transduction histidine kinase